MSYIIKRTGIYYSLSFEYSKQLKLYRLSTGFIKEAAKHE